LKCRRPNYLGLFRSETLARTQYGREGQHTANFFKPKDESAGLYANTTAGGYDHPWKITVKAGGRGKIGLWGGYDRGLPLAISSNNPGIIEFDEDPVTLASGEEKIGFNHRMR
jgi:hypothetical protein